MIKLFIASAIMGIVVYFFNVTLFDPTASLGIKLMVLSAEIGIGVILYALLSRLFKNEELTFLVELASKRGKQSPA